MHIEIEAELSQEETELIQVIVDQDVEALCDDKLFSKVFKLYYEQKNECHKNFIRHVPDAMQSALRSGKTLNDARKLLSTKAVIATLLKTGVFAVSSTLYGISNAISSATLGVSAWLLRLAGMTTNSPSYNSSIAFEDIIKMKMAILMEAFKDDQKIQTQIFDEYVQFSHTSGNIKKAVVLQGVIGLAALAAIAVDYGMNPRSPFSNEQPLNSRGSSYARWGISVVYTGSHALLSCLTLVKSQRGEQCYTAFDKLFRRRRSTFDISTYSLVNNMNVLDEGKNAGITGHDALELARNKVAEASPSCNNCCQPISKIKSKYEGFLYCMGYDTLYQRVINRVSQPSTKTNNTPRQRVRESQEQTTM